MQKLLPSRIISRPPRFQLPHISRLFTAMVVFCLVFGVVSLRDRLGLDRYNNIFPSFSLGNTDTGVQPDRDILGTAVVRDDVYLNQISYWKSVIGARPDYRDAYIQLAQAEYSLGQYTNAKETLTHALTLDPNNTTIEDFLAVIESSTLK